MTTRRIAPFLFAAPALLVGALWLRAGPLNPPAGPVTGTGKTLPEIFEAITTVEPRIAIMAANTPGDADSLYKITQPGSYYLAFSITGVAGKHGIEIAASGVTIDFNGFDLVGVPAMGAFDGVSITVGGLTNIAVFNGSVRNWGDDGVDLRTFGAVNCRVEGVCASGNGGDGISASFGTTVANCTASGNTGYGFACTGTTLLNCVARANTIAGIEADLSTLSNCSAFVNLGPGITASGSTVTNCAAGNNAGGGISVRDGSTVADCAARANNLDGIACTRSCTIRGNTCSANGSGGSNGAGIHATGSDNRIEGNNCTDSDGAQERGIDVDAAGNLIIRNTCSGNTTNWDVVAGNVILVVNGTTAGAVMGNTGGVAPGSTDPNANFTF